MENTIVKNPAYFFEVIRTNNKIRDIIKTDDMERDDVKLYLKNRGCISIDKYTGNLLYGRNDFYDEELSTNNMENVFSFISCLLTQMLKLELHRYYCKEHKCEDDSFTIGYLNYDIYNNCVVSYNPLIVNSDHYIFHKPAVDRLVKDIEKLKRKQTYDINNLFFLSYIKDDYENVNYFLSEDEILDILDFYYLNKDFVKYNSLYDIY